MCMWMWLPRETRHMDILLVTFIQMYSVRFIKLEYRACCPATCALAGNMCLNIGKQTTFLWIDSISLSFPFAPNATQVAPTKSESAETKTEHK